MTIETRDQLIRALGNAHSRLYVDKASIANAAAGQFHSLWRATGQPGQGAIPAAAARCTNATVGALNFTQQTAPATSYLGHARAMCANAGTTLEFHDRLIHMGGLDGTLTTAQTVGIDLSAHLASDNIAARIGDANYSDVLWALEWYTDTGGTAVTATVNVTFDDGTTGNLTGLSLAATRRASFLALLNGLNTNAARFIRGVNTVTLSASTGAVGNFGVTAFYPLGEIFLPLANVSYVANWTDLGLERVPNSACVSLVQLASTTSTGIVRATGKIIHG